MRPGRRVPPGTVLSPRRPTPTVLTRRRVGEDLGDGVRLVELADRPTTLDLVDGHRGGRRDAAAALHPRRPLADPERYQTVYARARPESVGGARPPACTSPPALLDRLGDRGRRRGRGRADRRPGHVPARSRSTRSRTTSCTASATGCRGRPSMPAVRPGSGAAGWSPSAPPRCGPWRAPRSRGSSKGAPTCSSTTGFEFEVVDRLLTNFHLPRSSLLVLIDAFVGPALARPLRRRPWPTTTASSPSATPCSSPGTSRAGRTPMIPTASTDRVVEMEIDATDGRPGPGGSRTARGTFETPVFMPVGTRGSVRTLSSVDLEDLGRRDHAGQHLPPDAAARRRPDRRAGRPARLHGLARPRAHRLGRLPGLLARAEGRRRGRHLPLDLRRQHATTSRPRTRSPSSASSAPTSRWCSTCARPCPATERSCGPRSTAPRAGPAGPGRVPGRARRRRTDAQRSQAQFGIVQGGVDLGLRRRERRADRRDRLRRLRHRRPVGGRAARRRCCRRSTRSPAVLPARPAPLPDGGGRPGRLRRGHRPRRRHVRLRAAHPPTPATARS